MIRVLVPQASSYPNKALNAVINARADGQLRLVSAKLVNNTGSAMDMGLARRLANGLVLSQLVGTAITNINAPISGNVQIFDTTNGDGFLVSAPEKFGLVGFTVSQDEAGTPAYTYKYYNGSSFVTLPTLSVPAAYKAANNECLIVFMPPYDWQVGGAVAGVVSGSVSQSAYNILVQAATAPSQAVKVSNFWVGSFFDYLPSVASKGSLYWSIALQDTMVKFLAGEGLLPYFATASTTNMVFAQTLAQDV